MLDLKTLQPPSKTMSINMCSFSEINITSKNISRASINLTAINRMGNVSRVQCVSYSSGDFFQEKKGPRADGIFAVSFEDRNVTDLKEGELTITFASQKKIGENYTCGYWNPEVERWKKKVNILYSRA